MTTVHTKGNVASMRCHHCIDYIALCECREHGLEDKSTHHTESSDSLASARLQSNQELPVIQNYREMLCVGRKAKCCIIRTTQRHCVRRYGPQGHAKVHGYIVTIELTFTVSRHLCGPRA